MNFENRLYDLQELCVMLKMSRFQLYRRRQIGAFPEPVRLGERTYRWVGSDLQQWWDDKRAEAVA